MIKAIISDSDGTLVNTLYLIRHGQYEATVKHLIKAGVPRHDIPEYEVFESYINKSVGGRTRETLEATVRLLYGITHEHHLKNIDFNELDRELQPIQDEIAPLYVHPYHGLTELFDWLGKNEMRLAIFTSGSAYMVVRHYGVALPVLGYTNLYLNDADNKTKLNAFTDRVTAVYGIPQFEVISADDVTQTKPDPEGILQALSRLDLKPEEVMVMGDHPYDVKAAKAAGVKAIVGTTHGFSTAAELKAAGAIRTVPSLLDIPVLIEAHNSGKSRLF